MAKLASVEGKKVHDEIIGFSLFLLKLTNSNVTWETPLPPPAQLIHHKNTLCNTALDLRNGASHLSQHQGEKVHDEIRLCINLFIFTNVNNAS